MDDVARVRKRPGMYLGLLEDGTALHNLVVGTVAAALARSRLSSSFSVEVVLRADLTATVLLTGSEQWHERDLNSFAKARLKAATSLFESIQLLPMALDIAGGSFVELVVVNALSDWMCDQMWNGRGVRAHMFREGDLESDCETWIVPEVSFGPQGLCTTFLPSAAVFPSIAFDAVRLKRELDGLVIQNPGVGVTLVDRR